jgi:DNA-binding response OmpR family regulator
MSRLLVVEDEVVIGIYLQEELQDAGFTVVVRNDAESALQALESEAFDAAIVDVELPGMSGIELLQRCRIARSDFPIVLASGIDSVVLHQKFSADPNVYLVPKPYQTTSLVACLERIGMAGHTTPRDYSSSINGTA